MSETLLARQIVSRLCSKYPSLPITEVADGPLTTIPSTQGVYFEDIAHLDLSDKHVLQFEGTPKRPFPEHQKSLTRWHESPFITKPFGFKWAKHIGDYQASYCWDIVNYNLQHGCSGGLMFANDGVLPSGSWASSSWKKNDHWTHIPDSVARVKQRGVHTKEVWQALGYAYHKRFDLINNHTLEELITLIKVNIDRNDRWQASEHDYDFVVWDDEPVFYHDPALIAPATGCPVGHEDNWYLGFEKYMVAVARAIKEIHHDADIASYHYSLFLFDYWEGNRNGNKDAQIAFSHDKFGKSLMPYQTYHMPSSYPAYHRSFRHTGSAPGLDTDTQVGYVLTAIREAQAYTKKIRVFTCGHNVNKWLTSVPWPSFNNPYPPDQIRAHTLAICWAGAETQSWTYHARRPDLKEEGDWYDPSWDSDVALPPGTPAYDHHSNYNYIQVPFTATDATNTSKDFVFEDIIKIVGETSTHATFRVVSPTTWVFDPAYGEFTMEKKVLKFLLRTIAHAYANHTEALFMAKFFEEVIRHGTLHWDRTPDNFYGWEPAILRISLGEYDFVFAYTTQLRGTQQYTATVTHGAASYRIAPEGLAKGSSWRPAIFIQKRV